MNKPVLLISFCLLLLFVIFASGTSAGETSTVKMERVSVASDGSEANDESWLPDISADGRFVVFTSRASNLVDDDNNGMEDIFIHDRDMHNTNRVSVALDGGDADGWSDQAAISVDGRFVAFGSSANDLVTGDTNSSMFFDVFVYDRVNKTTVRVSIASDGTESNGHSSHPSISADGNVVAFESEADNLVANDNNNERDIFVHTVSSGKTQRISVSSMGKEGNGWSGSGPEALSADGRFAAFVSAATNLVPGDSNNAPDAFVHNLETKETSLISANNRGIQADYGATRASISDNSRYIAFVSGASNLVPANDNLGQKVFIYDRILGGVSQASVAQCGIVQYSWSGLNGVSISENGQRVSFVSDSTALLGTGTSDPIHGYQVYLHDRQGLRTILVSTTNEGELPDGETMEPPSISGDGRFVAFKSYATDLVPDDNNEAIDIFVREMDESLPRPCIYLPAVLGK